jgi:hypothetical protein
VVAFRHAIRFDLPQLRLAARKIVAPLRFARGQTVYDAGAVRDFAVLAQLSEPAKRLRESIECPSFSSHEGQHQGVEAVGEEWIGRLKRELGPSDSEKRWDATVTAVDQAAGVRDAVDRSLGLAERARRPRSQEPIEPTLLRFCAALRQSNAFAATGRGVAVNLDGDVLQLGIEQLFTRGVERLRKFVNERYLTNKVSVQASRSSADTQRINVAGPEGASKLAAATAKAQVSAKAKPATAARPSTPQPEGKSNAKPKPKPKPKPKATAKRKAATEEDDDDDYVSHASASDAEHMAKKTFSAAIQASWAKKKQEQSDHALALSMDEQSD